MAYITKEYLENNIKAYDQYRNLNKEGQANGLATLDANGKLPASQSTQSDWNQSNSSAIDYIKNKPTIPSGVTYSSNEVSSIVQGANTSMSLNNGALTISVTNGGGGTIPVATSSTTGGVIVSNGGSKTFNYKWSGTDEAPTTTSGTRNKTVYKPLSNYSKYYPVECTTDGTATYCIPDSPWWDNSGTDPSTKVYVDITNGTDTFCPSAIIYCPSDAVFAELTYYPLNNEGTDFAGNSVVIPKIRSNETPIVPITFTIDASMKAISRSKSAYISLKFATGSHTYLTTIVFGYSARTRYSASIIC